jgi:hypothetical protein
LRETGPALTTELIERLVAAGATHAAARQRIVRGLASDYEIKRLAGLRFQHNARFLYLNDQWGDAAFWRALERAFRRSGHSYWRAVVGLRARGGWLPRALFAIACGAPSARRGQLSPDRVLERLRAIQLLDVELDGEGEELVTFRPYAYRKDPPEQVRARLLAEKVALEGVREWIRRLNLGSYNLVRVRSDDPQPQVSSLTWDVSAPSYVRPLVSVSEGKKVRSGFIVADILLRDVVQLEAVEAFVSKHDLAAALQNVGPIMPMLIADAYTRDAIKHARDRGLIPATIGVLLGDDIARALRDLVTMLTDLGASVSADPTRLDRVLGSLTKIEGAAGNVRGALFELAVGYLAREVEGGFMTAGLQVRDPLTGRPADIDVVVDRPDGAPVLVIECKAKSPGSLVSLAEVQRWRSDRVPLIQSALELDSRFRGRRLDFQLWSNGGLHDAAAMWLRVQPLPEGPHLVSWKDGVLLKDYVRTSGSGVIGKIMDEHYFRHPLTSIVRGRASP